MRKVVFAGLLLLLAGCGRDAFACSCVPPPGGATYVHHKDRLASYASNPAAPSDTIFLGTATKIELGRAGESFHPDNMIAVTFSVERVWADARTDPKTDRTTIIVQTNETDGMCGFDFKVGKRYFVFADRFETHICTPTSEYYNEAVAADYFKFLGDGRQPEKPGKPDKSEKTVQPEKSEKPAKPTSAERPPPGVV